MEEKEEKTKDQQEQLRKARVTLWSGIIAIAAIGLIIAIYFVFLKTPTNENTNIVNNTNTSEIVNTSPSENTVKLRNGSVSNECDIAEDCKFVRINMDYSECCVQPTCDRYFEEFFVPVNKTAFETFYNKLQDGSHCNAVRCPLYTQVLCEEPKITTSITCDDGMCVKHINEDQ